MTVSSVSGSSNVSSMQGSSAPEPPKDITKEGLQELRDRIAADGGDTTDLDTLISGFDDAAGEDGTMTMEELQAYAKDNDIELPEPPKGGKPPAPPDATSSSSTSAWMSESVGTNYNEYA